VTSLPAERLSWPTLFEPKLLACGPSQGSHGLLAVSPRGFGATAVVGASSETKAFRLTGISHLPPLAGASWTGPEFGEDKEGLLLFSRAGHLLSCSGQPPAHNGRWVCGSHRASSIPIFGEGVRLAAAAAAWLNGPAGVGGDPRLHAAIVDERTPDLVALYMLEETGAWLPLGEVALPAEQAAKNRRISLSFVNGGELLVGTGAGSLLRRRLADGAVLEVSVASDAEARSEWQAVCGFHGAAGGVAHLVLRQAAQQVTSWRPAQFRHHPWAKQGA
jgi:hypothetical protein